jgi:DNA-binding transcriptional LysR family regulator
LIDFFAFSKHPIMTLKQLEAFYWAATCANFELAARRLHLSTSSLSKRIAELEQSLDVLLFDRSTHKASLTEAGRALLGKAAHLLQAAEETRRSVARDKQLGGQCALGLGELSALTWLPRLASHLHSALPLIRLEFQVDIGSVLYQQLLNGTLDCAVVAGRSSHPSIASHVVGQARFLWVAAPRLVSSEQRVARSLLEKHPLVTLPRGAGTSGTLDDWLMEADIGLVRRLTCNSWGAVAALLVEGFGVGILPEGWARSFEGRHQLRILSSEVELAPLPYVFHHRRHDERAIVATMMEAVRKTVDFSISPKLL